MGLIVQKYGGSSLADIKCIKHVARRIIKSRIGRDLVVVVSAMGDTTDELISLAKELSPLPDRRELDLLLSTGEIVSATLLSIHLNFLGCPAISLTGFQAGIKTDAQYSRARILDVECRRILDELSKGRVVIVAGFQGVSGDEITTLGRGGSDTTAVALAVGLKAERCEIYTDVEGVYVADPRVVLGAAKLDEISYEEMLEFAWSGAKVIHPRAVEIGWIYNIPILVASSFSESTGTSIHGGVGMEVRRKIRGIAYDLDVARITIRGVPDRPGIASAIFEPLAREGISVDTIVQNVSLEGVTDLSFTVSRNDLDRAAEIIEHEVVPKVGARAWSKDVGLGKVSIIGVGMQGNPGYAARMFSALAAEGINIEMITTSEIRITCLIDEKKVPQGVKALYQAFELEKI